MVRKEPSRTYCEGDLTVLILHGSPKRTDDVAVWVPLVHNDKLDEFIECYM